MSATTDRIALVTGANKGIGFEAARGVAKSGYVVLLGHATDNWSPGRGHP